MHTIRIVVCVRGWTLEKYLKSCQQSTSVVCKTMCMYRSHFHIHDIIEVYVYVFSLLRIVESFVNNILMHKPLEYDVHEEISFTPLRAHQTRSEKTSVG